MENRRLDLDIIAADDLKKVTFLGKAQTYAVAWIEPYPRQKQRTKVDSSGGVNPVWNQMLSFLVPEQAIHQPNYGLVIEIYSQRSWGGDTFVGAVNTPLTELLKAGPGEILTYQVRRRSGRARGALRLSASLGDKITSAALPIVPPHDRPTYGSSEPVMAYPPPGYGAQAYPPAQQPYPSYPPQQGGYAAYPPPQGYYPQPGYGAYPQAYPPQQVPARRPGLGGMGMGLGTGLLAGALGGLIVGDLVGDAFDGGFGGGFDGGF